jgi:phospholipid-binding lipoprotein MlaA
VRDGTGLIVRAYASPLRYVIDDVPTRNILYGVGFVDLRAQPADETGSVDQAALDQYTFIRRSYLQRRDTWCTTAGRRRQERKTDDVR